MFNNQNVYVQGSNKIPVRALRMYLIFGLSRVVLGVDASGFQIFSIFQLFCLPESCVLSVHFKLRNYTVTLSLSIRFQIFIFH